LDIKVVRLVVKPICAVLTMQA